MPNRRYKKILVPLDGSELAEIALDDALDMAELNEAEVTLLQVISPIDHVIVASTGYPIYVDEQLDYNKTAALTYLSDLSTRWDVGDVPLQTVVQVGPVAETIVDYASQQDIDLVVMGTHGRSGISRWVYGSIAERVLQAASVPVLLVRAHKQGELRRKQQTTASTTPVAA